MRHEIDIYHCPDFHAAVAPWYSVSQRPRLLVLLVLHNAEYQGSINTDMINGDRLEKMAKIWNLSTHVVQKHLLSEGRFNMLKAAIDFVMERQGGLGVSAVSKHYAEECHSLYSLLWRLPEIAGLDSPMLEEERPVLKGHLSDVKREARKRIQELYSLDQNPNARLFVSLGRLVRQKGVDLLADIAEWLLTQFADAQLVVIGPPADGFGHYAAQKLERLTQMAAFRGRV